MLGYILNRTGPDMTPAVETNPAVLREMIDVPCLGEVPFLSEGENRAEVFQGRVKFELDGLAL
jgi:hypothetical protein